MEELFNVNLKNYSNMRIGGTAERMLFPKNIEELKEAYKIESKYIIANGSNILINDRIFKNVVNVSKMEEKIKNLTGGRFYVTASVKLPSFINYVNKLGYGGMEFLYCVPGTIGGAIYMNAGRGAHTGEFISNYIESVEVFDNGKIRTISKEDCKFSFRRSVFHDNKFIILSAIFKFSSMSIEESSLKKNERKKFCKINQDHSGGNLGSVFCVANGNILTIAKMFRIGKKKGAHFSGKSSNWIVNSGAGTFNQVISIIKIVEMLHKIIKKDIKREIIIWY